MRVLAVVHLYPPTHCAGAEMMLHSMLRPLVERGHDVQVMLSRPAGQDTYTFGGVTVHPGCGTAQIAHAIDAADVVISHLENVPRALILTRRAGKPLVVLMHNTHEASLKTAVSDAALIVLNSQWMAEAFGHPVNGLVVRPPVFAQDYRAIPGRKVTLVNVNGAKGGLLFAELARRMPDVEFLAVKGAYGEQVIPAGRNVEVREHGTDMRNVYASTRVLLMPSVYESWGRVGVEAMCSGIPVIAHPTPGLCESLDDAGTFADRDDPKAWESEIRRLLEPDVWAVASRAALRRAAELDPTTDLARWVDAVEEVTVDGLLPA